MSRGSLESGLRGPGSGRRRAPVQERNGAATRAADDHDVLLWSAARKESDAHSRLRCRADTFYQQMKCMSFTLLSQVMEGQCWHRELTVQWWRQIITCRSGAVKSTIDCLRARLDGIPQGRRKGWRVRLKQREEL